MWLTLKENTISFFYYTHIVEIPINKGANSYKLKMWKIGNRAVKITLFKPLDVRFVFLPQATDKKV